MLTGPILFILWWNQQPTSLNHSTQRTPLRRGEKEKAQGQNFCRRSKARAGSGR